MLFSSVTVDILLRSLAPQNTSTFPNLPGSCGGQEIPLSLIGYPRRLITAALGCSLGDSWLCILPPSCCLAPGHGGCSTILEHGLRAGPCGGRSRKLASASVPEYAWSEGQRCPPGIPTAELLPPAHGGARLALGFRHGRLAEAYKCG